MARVQDMHGGKDYDADFANRMKGRGPWDEVIAQRFAMASRKLGFNQEGVRLDSCAFQPPVPAGQGSLF